MSVFCVFGIKRRQCVEKARKLIPTEIKHHRKPATVFTQAQHSMYADLLADYIYVDDESKIAQIAAAFDTPQFARDWMDVAVKTDSARRMAIMVKKPKTDKNGDQIRRKGELVMSWQEWSPA